MLADILRKKWKQKLNFWLYRWEPRNTKKIQYVWGRIKDKIEEVSSGEYDYEKDYMKIKFNSDDDLPLNKPLKFRNMTIIVRSDFEENGKLYPHVFLDNTFYQLSI